MCSQGALTGVGVIVLLSSKEDYERGKRIPVKGKRRNYAQEKAYMNIYISVI